MTDVDLGKPDALEWMERQVKECRERYTVPDRRRQAMEIAAACIRESIERERPRVLSLDEVMALGDRECVRERTTDIEPVWVEERSGQQTRIEIGLVWYDSSVEEWMDKDEWTIYVKRFGTDYDTKLSVLDYGKTWRVWPALPTKEQRRETKWG